MRKLSAVILMVFVICMLAGSDISAGENVIEMDVYLIDACGGCGLPGMGCRACSIMDEISNRYRALFPNNEVALKLKNIRGDKSLESEMNERIEACNVDPDEVGFPVAFVEEKLFLADGSMDKELKNFVETGEYPGIETMLRAKEEYEEKQLSGKVVYLYSSYCEDCKEISKWLVYSVPTEYEVIKYDIYSEDGMEMEQYYRENLEIPDEEYCIPLIVYGDYWFAGKESIYLSLKSRIQEYPDLQTITLEKIEQ